MISAFVIKLINNKIKDDKLKNAVLEVERIVRTCVNKTNQTYVDELKKQGKFDKQAQELALTNCLAEVNIRLPEELHDFINKQYGNVSDYLTTLIESAVNESK